MKRIYIMAISLLLPLTIIAQQQTEYNIKGDEALKKSDYNDARLYYSEGLPNCDMYSISKLTEIWQGNSELRPSMYNLMGRCLSCLNNKAARSDTTAMAMLVIYYIEGVGTTQSQDMSNHWAAELSKLRTETIIETRPVDIATGQAKASTRYFAGYAFSMQTPVGVTIGGLGNRFGLYGRLKTNASFQEHEGEFTFAIDANGKETPPVAGDEYLWKREASKHKAITMTAGIIIRYNESLSFSFGIGYFQNDRIIRYSQLDDVENLVGESRYFKATNYSYEGMVTEADAIWTIKRFYVSAGLGGYISSKPYVDFNLGAGIFF